MTVEQNKAVVRRFFEEVFNQGKLAVADEIFAPWFSGRGLAGHGPGPESAKRAVTHLRAGFPDIQFTVEDLIADGDSVVVRVTFRGTHQGEFMGIPATGKAIEVGGVEMARLSGGQIVEEAWHFMDELGLLKQLGVLHHN
ncbi:MAG TPA: ester cyclase [Aggregatilineales bacterium]|nr:ester cyclase [Aggregatilineales bacterium]